MKVLASTLAAIALAQENAGDDGRAFDAAGFGDYELSAFDDLYGFGGSNYYYDDAFAATYEATDDAVGANRESANAAETGDDEKAKENRYFFTATQTGTTVTVKTTPITTADSTRKCWKCDAMTYATCASSGGYEDCPLGDQDCCFVEIREEYQALQQLCTGCKDKRACEDNKAENFNPTNAGAALENGNDVHQCRPDYRQQRIGKRENNQSVCRQCFKTCEAEGTYCFGSIVNTSTLPNINFKLNTDKASYPWGSARTAADFTGFGIPTYLMADATTSATITTAITNKSALLNVYFANTVDGKATTSTGLLVDSAEDPEEMLYWGLQGADKQWWESDLKAKQNSLKAVSAAQATTPPAVTDF